MNGLVMMSGTVMKAIRVHAYDDPAALRYETIPIPEIAGDEVLIRVAAAGVNPVDAKIQRGWKRDVLQHRLPLILGWDVAGEIARVGAMVARFKVGDRVFSRPDITRDGCFAEYAAVKADSVAHAPTTISLEEAAGIPLAALTAWTALFDAARLRAGQTILIHGAAGGVGLFAVQLAKLAGASVITTCSVSNTGLAIDLGADTVIDYRSRDFAAEVKNADAVLDTIGGEVQTRSLGVLRAGGTLVTVAGPADTETAIRLGVTAMFAGVSENAARLAELAAHVDAGRLRTITGARFPLVRASEALELSLTGHARGKIILQVRPGGVLNQREY